MAQTAWSVLDTRVYFAVAFRPQVSRFEGRLNFGEPCLDGSKLSHEKRMSSSKGDVSELFPRLRNGILLVLVGNVNRCTVCL